MKSKILFKLAIYPRLWLKSTKGAYVSSINRVFSLSREGIVIGVV